MINDRDDKQQGCQRERVRRTYIPLKHVHDMRDASPGVANASPPASPASAEQLPCWLLVLVHCASLSVLRTMHSQLSYTKVLLLLVIMPATAQDKSSFCSNGLRPALHCDVCQQPYSVLQGADCPCSPLISAALANSPAFVAAVTLRSACCIPALCCCQPLLRCLLLLLLLRCQEVCARRYGCSLNRPQSPTKPVFLLLAPPSPATAPPGSTYITPTYYSCRDAACIHCR